MQRQTNSEAKAQNTLDKEILSTGELASLCHMTKHTIISAIERGDLVASRTPGGHHRIRRNDALDFMMRFNLIPEGSKASKILIVDDENFVLDVMTELFEGDSYEIIHAANGYEAGKLAEREKPDLILLDILLPDVDGRVVCRHIREEEYGKNCRILAVTALRAEEDVEEIYSAGIDDYIAKPFSLDQLREKVEKLLRQKK